MLPTTVDHFRVWLGLASFQVLIYYVLLVVNSCYHLLLVVISCYHLLLVDTTYCYIAHVPPRGPNPNPNPNPAGGSRSWLYSVVELGGGQVLPTTVDHFRVWLGLASFQVLIYYVLLVVNSCYHLLLVVISCYHLLLVDTTYCYIAHVPPRGPNPNPNPNPAGGSRSWLYSVVELGGGQVLPTTVDHFQVWLRLTSFEVCYYLMITIVIWY